jgi:hypothetical protein
MSEPIVKLFDVVAISDKPEASDVMIEFGEKDVAFVPPPATFSVPETVGVNVRAEAVGVIVCPNVRPLNERVVVENVIAVPVVDA